MKLNSETTGLKIKLIYASKFEKYLAKVQTTKPLLKKNIKRLLEGLFRRGETILPKKDLGGNLVLLKGRIEKNNIADRFLVIIYIDRIFVIPVFIASKKSRDGVNINSHNSQYYQITKEVLESIKKDRYSVETIELKTSQIKLPGGLKIPS